MPRTLRTTFVGATDTNGEKIRVAGPHGQLTVAYDYGAYDMHDAAVLAYLARYNLSSEMLWHPDDTRRRLTRSGRGYTYLLADGRRSSTTVSPINGLHWV